MIVTSCQVLFPMNFGQERVVRFVRIKNHLALLMPCQFLSDAWHNMGIYQNLWMFLKIYIYRCVTLPSSMRTCDQKYFNYIQLYEYVNLGGQAGFGEFPYHVKRQHCAKGTTTSVTWLCFFSVLRPIQKLVAVYRNFRIAFSISAMIRTRIIKWDPFWGNQTRCQNVW